MTRPPVDVVVLSWNDGDLLHAAVASATDSRDVDVHVVVVKGAEEIGEAAAQALDAAGLEVLLDDRDQRPGEKFADADLIGCPIRVTAGKKSLEDGKVDLRDRATGEERRLAVADLGKDL